MNKNQPTTTGQTKKFPLHYPLTNKEWLIVTQDLKYAEVKVLYYLKTLAPTGEHDMSICVPDVAQALELDLSTVSKALKTLNEKDYLSLELTEIRVTQNDNGSRPNTHRITDPTWPE